MKKTINSLLLCMTTFAMATLLLMCKKQDANSMKPLSDKSLVAAAAAPQIVTFVHPGVLNTQASLDLVGSQVNGGEAVRSAAYQKVLDYVNNNALPTKFWETVTVGSNGATTESKSQIRKDAILAYALALRWAKTGTATYAQQCIAILNGWSYTFKQYAVLSGSNQYQPSLEASWTTPSFVAAAEIIRYYKAFGQSAGWSDADINQFNNYLNLVKNNYINNTPAYNNNWNASAGYAKMAIGIFLNSTTVYQNGYNIITQHLPIIIKSDGTIPEYCDRNDCVHYQYSLTAFAYAAELANIQGDNSLWTFNSNLLSKGYDYMRKAYARTTSCTTCSTSSPVFPGTEVAYNYYKTANLQYLRELQDPLYVPNDRTFLGFTSYTHFNVPGL
ncbi:alginate lyase family protein [Chitinophaga ginsengisoli]|uniref:Alginate lyase n=1 Tax=Chitinophaga ginsengisoli TaxID=363837 RepID=A0A2P8FC28_9BACT|nr:alginate lyase family protein [Chitinophaga ginsengisoli]PSL19269.1 alginate lyase [Chitinophaga ginsengisoli]